jgi:hypothetical protein
LNLEIALAFAQNDAESRDTLRKLFGKLQEILGKPDARARKWFHPGDSNCSPSRNCSHEALPFVEAPAKAKLAGGIKTQPGTHLATFSTFRIRDIPIMTARNKDVRRKRVLLGFHCRKLGLNIMYRRS